MKNLVACFSLIVTLACVELLIAADKPDFKSATRAPFSRPPEKSRNGKSIKAMKDQVEKMWSEVVFVKDGEPIEYVTTFETDAGDIEMEFYPDVAPNHVRNIICLSKVGYFDGLIFHRCIPGFVIQGGCPIGNGTGGPGFCLKQEFNRKPHLRGTLSMARASSPDSAGSQFFVCVAATPQLDNQYTVFGKVTQGMNVVDKIVTARTDANDRPLQPVSIKRAKVTIKVVKKKQD